MKKLIAAALLLALSGAPSVAEAAITPEAPVAVDKAPGRRLTEPVPVDVAPGDASDYAAREAAAPELGQFQGGDGGGIYIGGGALTVVLIVLLIVIII